MLLCLVSRVSDWRLKGATRLVKVPILVTSFCRPELTIEAATSLITRFPDTKIVVSQDGPIPGYYEGAHSLTRKNLIHLAQNSSNLVLNLRNRNQGLTQHLTDALEQIFNTSEGVIFLEEDMRICDEGIVFLSSCLTDIGLSHRTAFSSTSHPINENPRDYRLSFFPEQWGVSINRNTFEAFKDEKGRKTVSRSEVRKIIRTTSYPYLARELLVDFWTQLLRSEISRPHGWDALLQWTIWKNESPSKVSLQSHIQDLGGNIGSITKRIPLDIKEATENFKHNPRSREICPACELQDVKRRQFSPVSQVRNRLRIRNRISSYLSLRKYI